VKENDMSLSLKVKPFYMLRHTDVNGLSGTGVVAVGVVWPNGRVSMQWTSIRSSIENHDCMESIQELHGHNGNSEFIFGDPPNGDEKPKRSRKKKSDAQ
jgi:hypothetical protein